MTMFLDKFLENIFSNSLKDKQGPSFVYIYILTWLVINYPYTLAFLSATGGIGSNFSALNTVEESLYWWGPAFWGLLILVIKPWLNNIGLLARELSDKVTQKGLRALNIKNTEPRKNRKQSHQKSN